MKPGSNVDNKNGMPDPLQHEGKMPLKDRMEESEAYGEKVRAEKFGADKRETGSPTSAPNNGSDEIGMDK